MIIGQVLTLSNLFSLHYLNNILMLANRTKINLNSCLSLKEFSSVSIQCCEEYSSEKIGAIL
jgi:hypothetical protein